MLKTIYIITFSFFCFYTHGFKINNHLCEKHTGDPKALFNKHKFLFKIRADGTTRVDTNKFMFDYLVIENYKSPISSNVIHETIKNSGKTTLRINRIEEDNLYGADHINLNGIVRNKLYCYTDIEFDEIKKLSRKFLNPKSELKSAIDDSNWTRVKELISEGKIHDSEGRLDFLSFERLLQEKEGEKLASKVIKIIKNIDEKNFLTNETILHLLSKHNKKDLIKENINRFKDLSTEDNHGIPSIAYIIRNRDSETLQLFLTHKYNLSKVDQNKLTPLWYLMYSNSSIKEPVDQPLRFLSILKIILENDVSALKTTYNGESIVDRCAIDDNTKCLELINSYKKIKSNDLNIKLVRNYGPNSIRLLRELNALEQIQYEDTDNHKKKLLLAIRNNDLNAVNQLLSRINNINYVLPDQKNNKYNTCPLKEIRDDHQILKRLISLNIDYNQKCGNKASIINNVVFNAIKRCDYKTLLIYYKDFKDKKFIPSIDYSSSINSLLNLAEYNNNFTTYSCFKTIAYLINNNLLTKDYHLLAKALTSKHRDYVDQLFSLPLLEKDYLHIMRKLNTMDHNEHRYDYPFKSSQVQKNLKRMLKKHDITLPKDSKKIEVSISFKRGELYPLCGKFGNANIKEEPDEKSTTKGDVIFCLHAYGFFEEHNLRLYEIIGIKENWLRIKYFYKENPRSYKEGIESYGWINKNDIVTPTVAIIDNHYYPHPFAGLKKVEYNEKTRQLIFTGDNDLCSTSIMPYKVTRTRKKCTVSDFCFSVKTNINDIEIKTYTNSHRRGSCSGGC